MATKRISFLATIVLVSMFSWYFAPGHENRVDGDSSIYLYKVWRAQDFENDTLDPVVGIELRFIKDGRLVIVPNFRILESVNWRYEKKKLVFFGFKKRDMMASKKYLEMEIENVVEGKRTGRIDECDAVLTGYSLEKGIMEYNYSETAKSLNLLGYIFRPIAHGGKYLLQ